MLETLGISRPEIKIEENNQTYGRLVFEPLERGYGMTLGNALRRVLLSSINGAAIVAVRIEGVLHEFSTIPGVREDVIEILMNLKHVPVRSHSSEMRLLHLELDGGGEVRAKDIQVDSEVDFVDPEAKICTLEDGAHLSMDVFIDQGSGYLSSERPRSSYLPLDALLTDAIFSPVLRVNYEVEAARVGQRTDFEKLVLELWTNGVITPEDAVCEAAQIIKTYFGHVVDALSQDGERPDRPEPEPGRGGTVTTGTGTGTVGPGIGDRPVRELELSIRSENCLLRGGIHTIGDLTQKTKDDLLKIRNLGKISLKEIFEKLAAAGLTLREKNHSKTSKEE